jgi:hypothetical protein
MHKAIEMFTGMDVNAQTILALVNRPENALLLDHDSHKAFDSMCSWGIEAHVDASGTVSSIVHCALVSISLMTVGLESLLR